MTTFQEQFQATATRYNTDAHAAAWEQLTTQHPQFTAEHAARWASAGFQPAEAAALIDNGMLEPLPGMTAVTVDRPAKDR